MADSSMLATILALPRTIWTLAYEAFGSDNYNITVYGTFLIPFILFWVISCALMVVDLTAWPKALLKYKVQPGKNEPVPPGKMFKAVVIVIFNQTAVGIPLLALMYRGMVWRGSTFLPEDLPNVFILLGHLFVYMVIDDIGFYYLHRLFHHPMLYKWVHKLHHEWTAPVGLAATYAHPAEHVVVNLFPELISPVILGSHVSVVWVWMLLVTWTTVFHHSGYHFPGMPSPQFHDYHHLKYNVNYGVSELLDRLHGTLGSYKTSKARVRHRTLWSFSPMTKVIPDNQ